MAGASMPIRCDAAAVIQVFEELTEIVGRRGSLPEFFDRLCEIVESLPGAFESRWVDVEDGAATAGDRVLVLEFGQPFLDRMAALRALDRDFDASRQV